MGKKYNKTERFIDPTAFSKKFPIIRPLEGVGTLMSATGAEDSYKMGKVIASVVAPQEGHPLYFMSVRHPSRYPEWDEVVWLRYNLIPDAARMAMILPNLNSYINLPGPLEFVFTMEQVDWALEPVPQCEICGTGLELAHDDDSGVIDLYCKSVAHAYQITIDMKVWNEEHGNGYLAK